MFYERLLIRLRKEGFRPDAVVRYLKGTSGRARENLEENPEFIRSLLGTILILFGLIFLLATWVSISVGRETGTRFLLWSSGWLGLVFLWPLIHTGLSRDSSGAVVRYISWPNFLSLFRLSLVPGLFIVILNGNTGHAIALFGAGALSDVADGFVARKLSQQTRMGLVMDPLVDVAFNMSVIWALSVSGTLSLAVSLLLTARYLLLLGGAAYIYVFRGPVRIQPTVFGKLSAVFLSGMILAYMFLHDYSGILLRERLSALLEMALAILIAATILHVIIMGTYSLRLYPRVVATDEESREKKQDLGA